MPAKTQAEPVMVFSPEAFYDALRNAGFTMTGFAAEMGLIPETLSRWIAGASRPRPAMLPAIARKLHVKPEALLAEAEK